MSQHEGEELRDVPNAGTCHCGWVMPFARVTKLDIDWGSKVRVPEPPERIEVEVSVLCPQCGCGYVHEQALRHGEQIAFTPRKGIAQA